MPLAKVASVLKDDRYHHQTAALMTSYRLRPIDA